MSGDDVTIRTGGQILSGWTLIHITEGIEICPPHFDVGATDRFPGEARILVTAGSPFELYIGDDKVITGYIDRYSPTITPKTHDIRISGRGKTQDLVDCAAVWDSNQITSTSALDIATKLAKAYDISVKSNDGPGFSITQMNINQGESSWEIIEQVSRYSGFLAYEDRQGGLVLSRVGKDKMASGLELGVNVQSAAATYSMDGRYSEYVALMMSVDRLHDMGGNGNLLAKVTDPTLPAGFNGKARFRRRVIVSEQMQDGQFLAVQRANWEMARRYGRSQAVTVETDSWRDSKGALWTPNNYATVTIPPLGLVGQSWIIAEVSFMKDMERGTIAELILMPPEAFQPEPVLISPFDPQVYKDLHSNDVPLRPTGPS